MRSGPAYILAIASVLSVCPYVVASAQIPFAAESHQQSNLYPSRLSPVPPKAQQRPAKLLNFVSPQSASSDKVEARPASAAEPAFVEPRNEGFQENLDQLLGDDTDQTHGNDRKIAGQVEVVRQRYPDGKIQVERQVVQDADGNYMNHGTWQLFSRSGQVIASGLFEHGRMQGPWSRLHSPEEGGIFQGKPFTLFQGPFLSTATFDKGQLDGLWQIFDRNQRKIMEISYANGKRNGTATWWFPNDLKMREMRFVNGIIEGRLIERDEKNETVRDEEYIEGRRIITETAYYSPDRRRAESNFLDAQLVIDGEDDWWNAKPSKYRSVGSRIQEGPVTAWYENGQLEMRGEFKDNERVGELVVWHENGQKRLQGHFSKNQRDGLWTWWHENGMKASEGHFEDDQPIGAWISWDEKGKVTDRKKFTENELPAPNNKSLNADDSKESDNTEDATDSGDMLPMKSEAGSSSKPAEEIDLIDESGNTEAPKEDSNEIDFLEPPGKASPGTDIEAGSPERADSTSSTDSGSDSPRPLLNSNEQPKIPVDDEIDLDSLLESLSSSARAIFGIDVR